MADDDTTQAPQDAAQADPAPAAPDPAPEPADAVSDDAVALDAIINRWAFAHIYNSPVSQHVDAWNHLTAHLPALRDAILKGE